MTGLVLGAISLLLWPASGSVRRLRSLVRSGDTRRRHRDWNPIRLASIGGGIAVFAIVSGPVGIVAGAAVGYGLDRSLRRLETGAGRGRRRERERELPLALDLFAVALRAGLPLAGAAQVVSDGLDGPLSEDLHKVAALGALGADPPAAWAHAREDPLWSDVARAIARAGNSGSALSALMERMVEDRRAEQEQAAYAAVRRASVVAMAPLGLCFLPAFVCIGVVPVVIGLLSNAAL